MYQQRCASTTRAGQNHIYIYIYGVCTVFLAGKSPNIRSYIRIYIRFWPTLDIRSYTVHISVLANPKYNKKRKVLADSDK